MEERAGDGRRVGGDGEGARREGVRAHRFGGGNLPLAVQARDRAMGETMYEPSPRAADLQERVLAFMDRYVYPNEARFFDEVSAGDRWQPAPIVEELKAKARAEGLWNLFLPESERGAGLTNLEYAPALRDHGPRVLRRRGVQLLRARHRQHGGAGALRHARAEGALARAAPRRRDPLRLRHDRARGGLVRRHQHPRQHRARRRRLRHQRPQVVDLGRRRSALQGASSSWARPRPTARTGTASSR